MSTENDTSVERLPITASEIWNVLSAINCSEHAQEKNGLTFLSWAWAWGILMSKYPQALHTTLEDTHQPDGTMTVWCQVRIDHLVHTMWLPVMDYRNKAIPHPDARAISDSRMRCMTKCLALFGLGHYIYAGEDVPSADKVVEAPVQQQEPVKVVEPVRSDGFNIPDIETAKSTARFITDTARDFNSGSLDDLKSFWASNEALINHLKASFPEAYDEMVAAFTSIKENIGKE
jgi:hypothetical protein